MLFPENEIVEVFKDGSEGEKRQAFELLVREYSQKLYWQIRHLVISHDDANDVLQNTFVKAWLNIDSFMGYSKLYTWLFRIALNESLSFLNRRPQTVQIDGEAGNSLELQLESDPYFDGDETERQLQQAIATLPDKQRVVFNLRYFDGMKYEDMSRLLGTSTGALKTSYHLAVKKIEKYFNTID